jgi:hypothetical protein
VRRWICGASRKAWQRGMLRRRCKADDNDEERIYAVVNDNFEESCLPSRLADTFVMSEKRTKGGRDENGC